MYNALVFIKNILTNTAEITAQIPAANIYPLVASAKVTGDFVIYTVSRESKFTKDALMEFNCEVTVYADDILEAAQKADIIETQLTNYKEIFGQSATVNYTEDYKKAYIKINLTLKIN